MNSSIYRFTLGMNSSQSQISIPVLLGDTGREWHINLSNGGKPYIIADGCLAKLSIKRPTGSHLEEFCTIQDNTTIVYSFEQNENTAAVEGIHDCDISLYGLDGRLITSARFSMVVSERVINRDDVDLTDEDFTAVDAMVAAEAVRQANENTRIASETARNSAEEGRNSAEESRVEAEAERVSTENARIEAEAKRATAEGERVASEGARKTAEDGRVSAENKRVSNEDIRVSKDAQRDASINNALAASGRAEKNSTDAVNDVADLKEEFGSEALIMRETTVKGAVNYAVSTANDAKAQSDVTRTNLINLSAQVQGIGRSYVVPDFSYFIGFLNSSKSVELKEDRNGDGAEETYIVSISDLKSGDNIIITEKGVPDFWFEKNSALTTFETYPYNNTEYILSAKVGGLVIGGAHILETDYTVIEGFATSASASANNAKASETEAKESEANAKASETNAKASETNAKVSENNAKESETKAKEAAIDIAEKITEHTDVTYSYDNIELCPFEGYMNAVTGLATPSASWRATDYIAVNENTTIKSENVFGNAKATPVAFYDAGKAFVSSVIFETEGYNVLDVTPPANAKYARLSFLNGSSPIRVEGWRKALGEDKLVQSAGDSIDKVMSQKAVTDMVERFVDGECHILNNEMVVQETQNRGSYYHDPTRLAYKEALVFDFDVEVRAGSEYMVEVDTWSDTSMTPESFVSETRWSATHTVKSGTIFSILIRKTDSSVISISEYTNVKMYRVGGLDAEELNLSIENLADSVHHTTPVLRKEMVFNESQNGGVFAKESHRLAYKSPLLFNYDVEIRCEQGYKFEVDTWSDISLTPDSFVSEQFWFTEPYVVKAGTIFTLLIARRDEKVITVSEYDNVKLYRMLDFSWEETPEAESGILERNQTSLQNLYAASKYGYNKDGKSNQEKRFTALITTDVHADTARLRNAIEVLNKVGAIDCGFCLGDMQAGNFSESDGTWYTNIVNTSEKPFYTVLGNHDQMNYPCDMTGGTPTEAFNKFIQPTLDVLGQNISVPYYKVLFDTYKIALICLNNFDAPTEQNADGTFIIRRDTECISAEQLAWFVETLNTIPTDYHLIVARHSYPSGNQPIDNKWSQQTIFDPGSLAYSDNNIIPDIVEAWINGASLSKTYAPMSGFETCPTHNVNVDFSSRGKGNFVCHLVGHTHADLICTSTSYENQVIVGFCATAHDKYQNYLSDLPRVSGTRSEDAITAVTVDTASRKIRLVRFGSDITFDLVKRDVTTINY